MLRRLWSSDARWTAPALVTPRFTLTLAHEAVLGLLLAIPAAFAISRRGRHRLAAIARRHATDPATPPAPALMASAGARAAAWMILALAVAIGLPWLAVTDPQGLGFRLRVAAFVPLAMIAAIVGGHLVGPVAATLAARLHVPRRPRAWLERHAGGLLAVIAAALVIARAPADHTEGRIVAHPALVSAVLAMRGELPRDATLVVPERHIAFMAAWYTGAPVRLRPEQVAPERRWRLIPLALIGADSALDRSLLAARTQPRPPRGLHARHANGLVLVPEATWSWVLAQLPPPDRLRWSAWPTI
jgi:hypothetical protein